MTTTGSAAAPASPNDCGHQAAVRGVLAHEFAHYENAAGPEGPRRTVTYYGPVVGGLPIQAVHCPTCGLLTLSFPDGRREERRLYPGRQPGLLAQPTMVMPEAVLFGRQPRVSGLSVSSDLDRAFVAARPAGSRRAIVLPAWGAVTWISVLLLSLLALGLLAAGWLAVGGYTTPDIEGPLAIALVADFGGVLAVQIAAAVHRALYPPGRLAPSTAARHAGPQLDGAARAAVALLGLAAVGLLSSAILAVYDYTTSPAEGPVFVASLAAALMAAVVEVVAASTSRRRCR